MCKVLHFFKIKKKYIKIKQIFLAKENCFLIMDPSQNMPGKLKTAWEGQG